MEKNITITASITTQASSVHGSDMDVAASRSSEACGAASRVCWVCTANTLAVFVACRFAFCRVSHAGLGPFGKKIGHV